MKETIIQVIRETMADYGSRIDLGNIWREPIAGFVSADNPRLRELKTLVGENHYLPGDLLPEAKTIISYFLPFKEYIPKSNIAGAAASKEWALAYIHTNNVIVEINDRLVEAMEAGGYRGVKSPGAHGYDKEKLISSWSQRHIAFIAGIGTFGINNMLITEYGCCGRLGSIVTDCKIPEQSAALPERCIYKTTGRCGICRGRCVADAYPADTFDRFRCSTACKENGIRYKDLGDAGVCGKCLVGLPCSVKAPADR
ncbi:hypothetical protein [Breznakiella homolactica]|uniref:Epoxyqueuosine reductase n=1 Tax=Breznakiella homolactica TaxID=2798577 RepID=A0A7T8BCD3_9SPIR|nr:hypothetical protein [Breznakiella homolactica]QQO10128.1 hypothetical protein JFL75_04200 [Breznakiella homolactica]